MLLATPQQASPSCRLAASSADANGASWLPTGLRIAAPPPRHYAEPRAISAGRALILKTSRSARRPIGHPAAIHRKAFAQRSISLPGHYASEAGVAAVERLTSTS